MEDVLRLGLVAAPVLERNLDLGVQEPLALPAGSLPVVEPVRERHAELVERLLDATEPEGQLGVATIFDVDAEAVDPLQERVVRELDADLRLEALRERRRSILDILASVLDDFRDPLGDVVRS